jgi:subfamily B ATP-binding cassette protein HlyB/CyaB
VNNEQVPASGEAAAAVGGSAVSTDPALLAVALLAQLHQVPVDTAALAHEYAGNDGKLDTAGMLRALRALGFTAEQRRLGFAGLRKIALPAIAQLDDGRHALLGKVDDTQVFLQIVGDDRGATLTRADFERLWSGQTIIAVRHFGGELQRAFGIGWFWPALRRYRGLLGETLAASFFLQLFALVTPLAFQVVIDKVLVHRGLSTLDVIVLGLAVVTVFDVLLSVLRQYILSHTTNRVDVELGARLFTHMLNLPLSYFSARRVGDTVARLRELESVRNFLTGSALTVGIDLLFAVVFLAVMAYYSPMLTLIVIAAIPVFFAVSFVLTPLLRHQLDEKFSRGAENHSFLVETVGGIETIKSMAAEPRLRRQWEERLAGFVQSGFQAGHLSNLTQQGIQFVSKVLTVLLLWLGAKLVLEGSLTVGQLIAFNMLAARVNAPILRLASLWQDLQQVRVSLRRLADILDAPAEPLFKAGRSSLPELQGAVQFDHVTFRYRPDGPEVLRDISFSTRAGEVIGIAGTSGSGKSTLIKLLLRLYVPERGRVLIDGVDLAVVDAHWLRRRIGVVTQDIVLFNQTVRENIALGDPAMPMAQVEEAARLAGADAFIRALPDGYDTLVGERGGSLSGGQRQRIAIARALATQPRMLIFDEATSMLDAESEAALWRNLDVIAAGRTVFVITHRLSTLRRADRIVNLEGGRLVEQGRPEELLAAAGRYAELHRLQWGAAHA